MPFNHVDNFLIDNKVLRGLKRSIHKDEFSLVIKKFKHGSSLFFHEIGIGTKSMQTKYFRFRHVLMNFVTSSIYFID